MYVTLPPKVVLVGVPVDPLEIEGRDPQETTESDIERYKVC